MRELKFRIWDKESKSWYEPIYEAYVGKVDDLSISMSGELFRRTMSGSEHESVFPNRYLIQQYTGLKDKNGKEIYEGDILCFAGNLTADNSMGLDPNGFMYDESDKYQVVWHEDRAAFDLDYSGFDELPHWKYRRDTWGLMLNGSCEIIGNIYETPELLEK